MGTEQDRFLSGRRWLKRIGLAWLIAGALAIAAWSAWNWEARRRCDATIASLRSRGEPVTWSDLHLEELPDAQNAAVILSKAATAPNSEALALLHKIRSVPKARLAILTKKGPEFRQLLGITGLARLGRDAAIQAQRSGDTLGAIEHIRDVRAVAHSIVGEPSLLISGLLGLIGNGIAMEGLQTIAPRIQIDATSAEEVRKLIADLHADDSFARDAVAKGFRGERLMSTDRYLRNSAEQQGWLLARPLSLLAINTLIRQTDRMADEVQQMHPITVPERNVLTLLTGIPQFTNVMQDIILNTLQQRAAAVTLALRLYRYENGHYPASLDELMPAYLPTIPADPRNSAGEAIGYILLESGERPILYSLERPAAQPSPEKGVPQAPTTFNRLAPGAVIYQDVTDWTGKSSGQERGDNEVQQPAQQGNGDQPVQDRQQKDSR